MQVYGISNFGSTRHQTQNSNNYMTKINSNLNPAKLSFGAYLTESDKALIDLFNDVINIFNQRGKKVLDAITSDGIKVEFDTQTIGNSLSRIHNQPVEHVISVISPKGEQGIRYFKQSKEINKSNCAGWIPENELQLLKKNAISYLTAIKTKYTKVNNI